MSGQLKIFITGSADGLGYLSAKALIDSGHQVFLHARNEERKNDLIRNLPSGTKVFTSDLRSIEETKSLAEEINQYGTMNAVIHNAGVYTAASKELFAVNTIAPFILTSLINKPQRLIYLSSGMHLSGTAKPDDIKLNINRINYSDTKLHVLMICLAISRRWKDVYANTVNPGWVPTKMGGAGAPDDLNKGYATQVWLATGNDEEATVSGRYFFHKKIKPHNPEADDIALQEKLIKICEEITGVEFPE